MRSASIHRAANEQCAKAEWRRVAPDLHRLGLLTILDHMAFGAIADGPAIHGRYADLLTAAIGVAQLAGGQRACKEFTERFYPMLPEATRNELPFDVFSNAIREEAAQIDAKKRGFFSRIFRA
jgi:hypothetical protein